MAESLKFGLVGYGNIGRKHARILQSMNMLAAICDTNQTHLSQAKADFNVELYSNFDAFINNATDLTAVAICTPNYLHATQTKAALTKGYHTLCEKPMAIHFGDCLSMKKTAKEANKLLKIVKQNRYNGPIQQLKHLIQSKELGEIASFSMNIVWARGEDYYTNTWRGTLDKDGGILYTQFSHFVDIIIWLFGNISSSKAYGQNKFHKHYTEFEDTIVIILQTETGILGTIHASTNSFQKNAEGSLFVTGSKGTIKIGGTYLNEVEYLQMDTSYTFSTDEINYEANNYGSYTGSKSSHPEVYKDFVSRIRNGEVSDRDLDDSIATVAFIEQLYQQIRGFDSHGELKENII